MTKPYDMSETCRRDLVNAIFGERIGKGASRETFVYEPNPKYVIKLEDRGHWFQNIQEWNTWLEVKDTKHAKWFAPCQWISPTGTILLQERTTVVARRDVPTKIPEYFTDLKLANFGWLGDNFVCHDYGIIKLADIALKKSKLRSTKGMFQGDTTTFS